MPQCGIGEAGSLRRGDLERLERLFVIEPVEQRQAFIEKLLRVRVRGLDRAVIRTEIAEQGRARRPPPRGLRLHARRAPTDSRAAPARACREHATIAAIIHAAATIGIRSLIRSASGSRATTPFPRPTTGLRWLDARPARPVPVNHRPSLRPGRSERSPAQGPRKTSGSASDRRDSSQSVSTVAPTKTTNARSRCRKSKRPTVARAASRADAGIKRRIDPTAHLGAESGLDKCEGNQDRDHCRCTRLPDVPGAPDARECFERCVTAAAAR